MIRCRHNDQGACHLGLYGGRPSPGTCLRACDQWAGPFRGLGDLVHAITTRTMIARLVHYRRPLCGCRRRRHQWNAWTLQPLKTALARPIQALFTRINRPSRRK